MYCENWITIDNSSVNLVPYKYTLTHINIYICNRSKKQKIKISLCFKLTVNVVYLLERFCVRISEGSVLKTVLQPRMAVISITYYSLLISINF